MIIYFDHIYFDHIKVSSHKVRPKMKDMEDLTKLAKIIDVLYYKIDIIKNFCGMQDQDDVEIKSLSHERDTLIKIWWDKYNDFKNKRPIV